MMPTMQTQLSPEIIEVGGLYFTIQRSERRRTMALTVGRDGQLSASVPAAMGNAEICTWINRKLLWVHQKLAQKTEFSLQRSAPQFISGERFSDLGRSYRLQLVDQQRSALHFDGHQFLLRVDARPTADQHFRHWYRRQGQPWLEERVHNLTRYVGVTPSGIEVRDLAYRWGSCSRNRHIYFHWKVLQLPVHLIDYVIVHELAHLVEPHHGPTFWACVERALPDWKERSAELDLSAGLFLRMSI